MNCPICYDGQLKEQLVEEWMRQGNHWVLFKNVPALACDLCGESTFSQETSARLLQILRSDVALLPTFPIMVPVIDLQLIDAAAMVAAIKWDTTVSLSQESSDADQWRVYSAGTTETELSVA